MTTTRTTKRRRLGALAATVVLLAGAAVAVSAGQSSAPKSTRCEALPYLWTGAQEINYDAQARTVTFVWDDAQATMRDTDPGCSSQPGLDAELLGNREGWLASERASCQDLQNLVDAVKAERRATGASTSGRVPVSDQAAVAAPRQNPSGGAELASSGAIEIKNHAAGQRFIDLDHSQAVLEKCPL